MKNQLSKPLLFLAAATIGILTIASPSCLSNVDRVQDQDSTIVADQETMTTSYDESNEDPEVLFNKAKSMKIGESVEWYVKAAEAGHTEAQARVGWFYYMGLFIGEQDYNKAFSWFSKAAEKGNPEAQYYIGIMYENGESVKKDSNKAFEWVKKSAEHGFFKAQEELAYMYERGIGTTKDAAASAEWLKRAANNKDNIYQ